MLIIFVKRSISSLSLTSTTFGTTFRSWRIFLLIDYVEEELLYTMYMNEKQGNCHKASAQNNIKRLHSNKTRESPETK